MDQCAIRGVICSLEWLLNSNKYEATFTEGKPISYWIAFLSGYMVKTIESNDPNELANALELAPTLRDIVSRHNDSLDTKIILNTHKEE